MAINNHSYAVLAVLLAVECVEAIASVSAIATGLAHILVFFAGALIGAGVLNLNGWLTLASIVPGAIMGDALAYEPGRRYHADIGPWIEESGRHDSWVRCGRFVERHGVWSLVRARFSTRVCPLVPLLYGSTHMGRPKSYALNVASALAWTLVSLAPGMVVGALPRVAEAISLRMTFAMIALAVLLYLVVRMVRLAITSGIPLLKQVARHAVLVLIRGFPGFGDGVQRRIKVDDPAFPAVCAFTLLFVACVWVFGGVLQGVDSRPSPIREVAGADLREIFTSS
ncbi:DedA family protein [Burkholderia anthina]|uniref:DedA family protein n=1 Tax=Burkholderia anthina TaxID=179879 RepID=UPI00158A168A|nr:hypothetical protein [Burkholderia anthina]